MKQVPEFKTDAEAEAFLEQDLSDLDFTQFKPMRFEIARKEAALNMRIPRALLELSDIEAQCASLRATLLQALAEPNVVHLRTAHLDGG